MRLIIRDGVWQPYFITRVSAPDGREARLEVDGSGLLTNIVDSMGMASAVHYDPSYGQPDSLLTPYGLTLFQFVLGGGGTSLDRAWMITQPDGGRQAYMLTDGHYGLDMPEVFQNSQLPTNTPFTTGTHPYGTLAVTNRHVRNTFFWNTKQFAALGSTNLTAFTWTQFIHSRNRHWLGYNVLSGANHVDTLAYEQEPSPNGTTEGQITWYDYDGKDYDAIDLRGTQKEPAVIARVLPDGSTWYSWLRRNSIGHATNIVSTYTTPAGVIALRTNIYFYAANEIDLLRHIGPDGIIEAAYGYNNYHQVVAMTNALDEVTRYTYSADKQLTSIRHPNGAVLTNLYGVDGYLAQSILVGFYTNSYTYTNGVVQTHTDGRGLTVSKAWDGLRRLKSVSYPDSTSISYVYNKLDLARVVDRMGFTTSYAYDSMRRMVATTNALGAVTAYDYCTCGLLESTTDALGNQTHFYYDAAGRLTNTVYADGSSLGQTYDLAGQLVASLDSSGNRILNKYNNQGLIVTVSNTFGQVAAYRYDIDDRPTNYVDANGVNVAMAYDDLGRLLARTFPDGGVETFHYCKNIAGITNFVDQIGNTMIYAYDLIGHKTNEIYVGVTTNSFSYSGAGDLVALTDGKNQITRWDYDTFGRVTNKVDAAGNILFGYQYDSDNRLINRWTPSKGATTYSFDNVGNLTLVNYPTSPDITLQYDKLNRLTNMVDAIGTTSYGWDTVGQLLKEDGPWSDDAVSFTYANRLRISLSLASPNSEAWAQIYDYDTARRLNRVTSPAGNFEYAYPGSRPSSLVTRISLPNGAFITNTYDNLARLTNTDLRNSGGASLDSYTYTYNPANQRTNVVRTDGSSVAYGYDSIGQLKTAIGKTIGNTNRLNEQFGYAYDAAGNLNYRTNHTLVQAFNVNNLNELTTVTNNGRLTVVGTTAGLATSVTVNATNAFLYADATFASTNHLRVNGNNTYTAIAADNYGRYDTNIVMVDLPGTNTFLYDLNGNMRTNGTRIFDYDDENQLTRITEPGAWKAEFAYDGKMRRRIEKNFAWNGSAWMQTNEGRFVYDGNVVLQERDTNNIPQVMLTRGNDLSGTLQGAGGIGGLLALTSNSQLLTFAANVHSYYHADGNGNITMMINANQVPVSKYLYDPFGNTLSASGPMAFVNRYRFSSKPIQELSGFYDYLYRWCAPNLQRWLNRDPIQERGDYNLYRFLGNYTIGQIDPYGFMAYNLGLYALQQEKKEAKCCEAKGGKYLSLAETSYGGDQMKCTEALWSGVPIQSLPGSIQLPIGVLGLFPPVGIGVLGGSALQYAMAYRACAKKYCVGGHDPAPPVPPFPWPKPIEQYHSCSTCDVNTPAIKLND